MSPWAICASIIESPLTVSAKTSFLKKTSLKSSVSLTSEKVSISPPAATEPIIGIPADLIESII